MNVADKTRFTKHLLPPYLKLSWLFFGKHFVKFRQLAYQLTLVTEQMPVEARIRFTAPTDLPVAVQSWTATCPLLDKDTNLGKAQRS
ncbi:hypothetical protein GCM10027347_56670 [Larkinella harenae]